MIHLLLQASRSVFLQVKSNSCCWHEKQGRQAESEKGHLIIKIGLDLIPYFIILLKKMAGFTSKYLDTPSDIQLEQRSFRLSKS